jgi:hypothetical protein
MHTFNQHKLKKNEWEAIEVPISSNEKNILGLIMDGYDNTAASFNNNKSILSFMKMKSTPTFHSHLYEIYFKPVVDKINKKLKKKGIDPIEIIIKKEKTKLKSADKIRIDNTAEQIKINNERIYEFVLLNCCKAYIKNMDDMYYYTIIHLLKNSIDNVNNYVLEFIAKFKCKFSVNKENIIYNASKNIEDNEGLQMYNDVSLYSHQKELFNICKTKRSEPKLIFYQAPTGTGKTMSPLALTKEYKVIFVCAAKHIGLQLARACISMHIPIGIAFGCDDSSGVRLHYYAAKEYTKNYRTGGIYRVDHSIGNKVELIVCDLKSYIPAMYYMLSFNKAEDIILYWDEPTIALDYETHDMHQVINKNWSENQIPNIILSSATLPSVDSIPNCLMSFKTNNITGNTYTINSSDCKKTISIIDKNGYYVVPHLIYEDEADLNKSLAHIKMFKTILRHFNVGEITKFIRYVQEYLPEELKINSYFHDNLENITILNIKLYYLECLHHSTIRENWTKIFVYFRTKREKLYDSSVYITTKDAHTLTGGPTIFLTEDVDKIATFYIQQSKIPRTELDNIKTTLDYNNKLISSITKLKNQLNLDEEKEKLSDEERELLEKIKETEMKQRELTLNKYYVPNSKEHLYRFTNQTVSNAFTSSLVESDIEKIILLNIPDKYKLLLLMGIGVFDENLPIEYLEVMKLLATEQKLFVIIASSDYIYGTNYQFCHGYLSKDLLKMTQEKVIQCFGRVGRGNKQYTYTIRLRDDGFIYKVFEKERNKIEAANMNMLFTN